MPMKPVVRRVWIRNLITHGQAPLHEEVQEAMPVDIMRHRESRVWEVPRPQASRLHRVERVEEGVVVAVVAVARVVQVPRNQEPVVERVERVFRLQLWASMQEMR